jgi:uncharacterized protein (DUF433 family)
MKKSKSATKKEPVEVGRYLIVHPGICFGKLTFKGTRVPVSTVLAYMAKGWTIDKVLKGWPQLSREAVQEAIRLASSALVERFTPEYAETDEPIHTR